MRITFLLPANDLSGGVRVAVAYAQHLRTRGHDVLIVHPAPALSLGRRAKSWAAARWRVTRQAPPTVLDRAGVQHLELSSHRPVTDADLPDADVIVATWLHCVEWMAALSPSKGAKVHLAQGDDRGSLRFDPSLVQRVEATWRLGIPKLAVSEWVAAQIMAVNPAAQIDVIPNGVDLELFHAPRRGRQKSPRVGFVYSAARCKGTDILLAAIAEARRTSGALAITAFGAAAPLHELPLPPDTHFVLRPPQECLRDLYSQCDAWLFASRAEGYGLPILEAMACRTPVIATPAGAAPELLAGGGGMLIEPESPAAMAAAITRFAAMADPEWSALSDEALAIAQQHTWQRATDGLEEALGRVAAVSAGVSMRAGF